MKLKSILCTTLSAALLCAGAFAAGVSGPQGGESVTSLPLAPAGEAEQPVQPGRVAQGVQAACWPIVQAHVERRPAGDCGVQAEPAAWIAAVEPTQRVAAWLQPQLEACWRAQTPVHGEAARA